MAGAGHSSTLAIAPPGYEMSPPQCGLVDWRDVSPARVAMSCNTGAADDCRTTSARADLRAASAASRGLLGAWLGPF